MNDLTIVCVNYHMREALLQALASVFLDLKDCPYRVGVVVVDNSSNADGVKELLARDYPAVKYLSPGNVGFGAGNTLGFTEAPARYYFALNCDTTIPTDTQTIARLIRFMDREPRVGAVGPKLLYPDGTIQPSCYRFDLPSMLIKPLRHLGWGRNLKRVKQATTQLLMEDFDHAHTRPVDWVLGAALLVRHEAIEQAGWFDDQYFLYLEDADWCRTLWAHGWPVYYLHDVEIVHRHARESAKIPGLFQALLKNPLARFHAKSWVYFLWKWRKHFSTYGDRSS